VIFHTTPLAGLYEIDTEPHADGRGSFTRLYCEQTCEQTLGEVAPGARVVQVNHSVSRQRGTLRGLHFQHAPAADGKLVRCLRGRVFDVAVDLRHGSPTFARWHALELAGEGTRGLWVPPGFAHGFQTLADDTELLYLHTAAHSPAHEAGLRFDDAQLAIPWPLTPTQLSPRDLALPFLTPQFQGVLL
jgi:dTDP-4-dehydrorhamnose 3,5-epimerase